LLCCGSPISLITPDRSFRLSWCCSSPKGLVIPETPIHIILGFVIHIFFWTCREHNEGMTNPISQGATKDGRKFRFAVRRRCLPNLSTEAERSTIFKGSELGVEPHLRCKKRLASCSCNPLRLIFPLRKLGMARALFQAFQMVSLRD